MDKKFDMKSSRASAGFKAVFGFNDLHKSGKFADRGFRNRGEAQDKRCLDL